jgi:hypothetical protein
MNPKSAVGCWSAEGGALFRAANISTLAASPVFACMMLLTVRYQDAQDILCGAAGSAPWTGMTAMYVFMCIVVRSGLPLQIHILKPFASRCASSSRIG